MSTNYYHHTNLCTCCGRFDTVHIGLSAMGWQFLFETTEQAKSWQEWKELLKAGEIYDEYDRVVPYDEFVAFVEEKQARETRNHARLYPNREDNFVDPEGYAFSRGFS